MPEMVDVVLSYQDSSFKIYIDLDDPAFWSKMLPEANLDIDAAAAAEMDAAAALAGADRLRVRRAPPIEPRVAVVTTI